MINFSNGFRYALASQIDMEDEIIAFREFKYFINIVFPKIISDYVQYFKPIHPEVLSLKTYIKMVGDKKIVSHYDDGRYAAEKEKSPLEIFINSRKYFMPEAMSKKAAAKFCIYLGHFLNDYEIGYVYNSKNITIDDLDDNIYEYLFEGAKDANIFLSNTIKQNITAYYLEKLRLMEYENRASQMAESQDKYAKEKYILDLMADDVIKGRKLKK